MLEIGIVGLPNVGKSTLFNALTKASADVSNYPFCTIEPNEAVVVVPDERPHELARIFGQEHVVLAAFKFVDIAGLVRNAHQGDGLGNQFLSHIREVDALLHLVRCFFDPAVTHVDGVVDPVRDAETVEEELTKADLDTVNRRADNLNRKTRVGDREAALEITVCDKVKAHLMEGQPARTLHLNSDERDTIKQYNLLTAKPPLFAVNINDNNTSTAAFEKLKAWCETRSMTTLSIDAKLNAELAELDEDDAAELSLELGLENLAFDNIIHACFALLDTIMFFTAVGKEVTAWPIARGMTAGEAAGRIHTDMGRGFIRAHVISFDELSNAGSWSAAQDAGIVDVRGRNYVVQDGDVIHFRFNAKTAG